MFPLRERRSETLRPAELSGGVRQLQVWGVVLWQACQDPFLRGRCQQAGPCGSSTGGRSTGSSARFSWPLSHSGPACSAGMRCGHRCSRGLVTNVPPNLGNPYSGRGLCGFTGAQPVILTSVWWEGKSGLGRGGPGRPGPWIPVVLDKTTHKASACFRCVSGEWRV